MRISVAAILAVHCILIGCSKPHEQGGRQIVEKEPITVGGPGVVLSTAQFGEMRGSSSFLMHQSYAGKYADWSLSLIASVVMEDGERVISLSLPVQTGTLPSSKMYVLSMERGAGFATMATESEGYLSEAGWVNLEVLEGTKFKAEFEINLVLAGETVSRVAVTGTATGSWHPECWYAVPLNGELVSGDGGAALPPPEEQVRWVYDPTYSSTYCAAFADL